MTPHIRAKDLLHDYGDGPVIDIPQLDIPPGRWHLTGSNGSGKTTLLRILATLLTPTRGEVTLQGHDAYHEGARIRRSMGYVGHQPSLHTTLPAESALALHADLHNLPRETVMDALGNWTLDDQANTRVQNLSHGQRRRLDLARAMLHGPDIVLLDEPTTGLDEASQRVLMDRLDAVDPSIVLVASPTPSGLQTEGTFRLKRGRLVGAPP